MKTTITITMDTEVLKIAKSRDINISGVCNGLLKQYLEMEKIMKKPSEELEKEIQEKEANLYALRSHLEIVKKKEKEEEGISLSLEEKQLGGKTKIPFRKNW